MIHVPPYIRRGSSFMAALCLMAGLGACAKKDATPLPEEINGFRFELPTESEDQAHELMKLSRANCADNALCPESVGLLVVATPRALGMCTGFLLGPDLAMTNSHCIREFIKENPRSCPGNLELIFPESGKRAAERAGCAEVISFSSMRNDEANAPDFAFIRLDRSLGRAPLGLDSRGFSEKEPLSLVKMNPISTGSYALAELQVVRCAPAYRSWLLPQADNPGSPVMVVAGCEVTNASSGSPLLDSEGRVRGLIQRRLGAPSELTKSELVEDPEFLALAASLACIQVPGFPTQKFPDSCAEDLSPGATARLREELLVNVPEAADEALRAAIQTWARSKSNPSNPVVWNALNYGDRQGNVRTVTVEPRCFVGPGEQNEWLKKYRSFGRYSKSASISFTLPFWDVRVGYNGKLQPAYKILPLSNRAGTLEFSPSRLHDHASSDTAFKIPGLRPEIQRSGPLEFCR